MERRGDTKRTWHPSLWFEELFAGQQFVKYAGLDETISARFGDTNNE